MSSRLAAQHEYPSSSSTATLRVNTMVSEPKTVDESSPLGQENSHFSGEKGFPIPRQPQMLGTRELHPAFDTMRWLCLVSHVGLIILLIALSVKPADEQFTGTIFFSKPSFPVDDFDDVGETLQTSVKIGFGWIVTAWTVLLTLTTQRLALRRQLGLYNSLTAKHDANSAWMSLGSAILTSLNWRQLGIRASLSSLFLPLAYLAGIASLHSVATSMFGLVPKPTNTTLPYQTQGIPDFSGASVGNIFAGAGALVTMQSLSNLNFPGLGSGNLGFIYDTPIPDSDPEIYNQISSLRMDLEVNATYFNVTCGSLTGSVQELTDSTREFFFGPEFGLGNIPTVLPSVISQQSLVIRSAPWGPSFNGTNGTADPKGSWPSSLLIFSTVPVVDSSNTRVQPIQFSPPMTYVPFGQKSQTSTNQLTAMACNLTVDLSSNKATIDPRSNALLDIKGIVNKTSSRTGAFPTVKRTAPMDLVGNPADDLIWVWTELPTSAVSPLDSLLGGNCLVANQESACGTTFEPEQFAMEALNIFPDILLDEQSASSIALHDLENVLSRMSAIEFWAEGQGTSQKFSNSLTTEGVSAVNTNVQFVTNENEVQVTNFNLVFALNRTQLFGALAIALVLLMLAAPSLFFNNNLKIDSIGILQMIWLANDHRELHRPITKLRDPSIDELRKEGARVRRNFGDSKHAQSVADNV